VSGRAEGRDAAGRTDRLYGSVLDYGPLAPTKPRKQPAQNGCTPHEQGAQPTPMSPSWQYWRSVIIYADCYYGSNDKRIGPVKEPGIRRVADTGQLPRLPWVHPGFYWDDVANLRSPSIYLCYVLILLHIRMRHRSLWRPRHALVCTIAKQDFWPPFG
jgi:hypothetical protein